MYGECEPTFITKFFHELPLLWTLTDETGNKNKVYFNNSLESPLLTHGWNELRKIYEFVAYQGLYIAYLGNGLFKLVVLPEISTREHFPS